MKHEREDPFKYHLVLAIGLLLMVAGEQWLESLELTVLGSAVIGLGIVSKQSLLRTQSPRN